MNSRRKRGIFKTLFLDKIPNVCNLHAKYNFHTLPAIFRVAPVPSFMQFLFRFGQVVRTTTHPPMESLVCGIHPISLFLRNEMNSGNRPHWH